MAVVDLRSDTVTRPSPGMRRAMADAEVGDDVYGEDPMVNRLQDAAAALLGVEAALLVPSGTMGNQASIRALTRPGDVIAASVDAHILMYESGAAAALSGVQIQTLGDASTGSFSGDDLRGAIRPAESHFAPLGLVAVENTHNRSGGRIIPLERIKDIAGTAREHGLPLHLDGARLFHAVVATGVDAATWAQPFDTVTFCLSKGLGAPVGSLICGSAEVIGRVHRARKMLGGGMRQAGILAAAGLYALQHNIDRLADDHANARRFAAGLEAQGFRVHGPVETNMVMFDVRDTEAFVRESLARDLLINSVYPGRFRAVTHLDVDADAIDDALERIRGIVDGGVR